MKQFCISLVLICTLLLLTACTGNSPTDPPDVSEPIAHKSELSVFDGTYRAQVASEADEAYVQITAEGDFILLEHFLCMDGSVYSFWAEEFWPSEDGFTQVPITSVSGKSQTFSNMTEELSYDTLPRNRVISLTDAGVVLNYDDTDSAYYVRVSDFSYHTDPLQLRLMLGESSVREPSALYGTWVSRNGRDALCLTLNVDGSLFLLRKTAGQPAQVYNGGYILEKGNRLNILAERIGDGLFPHFITLQWKIDRDGILWITFETEEPWVLMPTKVPITKTVEPKKALCYFVTVYNMTGAYTDQYGIDYSYIFCLPQFLGTDPKIEAVNAEIWNHYAPIIEEECLSMDQCEFLTFSEVNWESNIYEDILYLHIFAKSWDWEEHSAYYYDTSAGRFLTTEEVLDRLLIDHGYFLEAVKESAQESYTEVFSDIPEAYREEAGYYEMLEWTGSEEAVNLQLPIFVDRFGSIQVLAKIGSMAGAGIIWKTLRPFDGAVG